MPKEKRKMTHGRLIYPKYWFSSYFILLMFGVIITACGGGGSDNSKPMANAGMNQNVTTGSQVTLDGSLSSDPDGDEMTYAWSFVSIPDGINAALSNTTILNPSFVADSDGAYLIGLVVNDGIVDSEMDIVTIRASSEIPEYNVTIDGEEGGYDTIQAAIDAAIDYDLILVHDGTYYENINFFGKPITVKSVNGPSATIIDGNTNGSSVVRFAANETPDSVLDGFTITNGVASCGGGVLCGESSPTIRNCIITNNVAVDNGGGIYCDDGASATIDSCTIIGNSAGGPGGGIGCYASSPTISNCTISNNTSREFGGGIGCEAFSSPTIIKNSVSDNSPDDISGTSGSVCGIDSVIEGALFID